MSCIDCESSDVKWLQQYERHDPPFISYSEVKYCDSCKIKEERRIDRPAGQSEPEVTIEWIPVFIGETVTCSVCDKTFGKKDLVERALTNDNFSFGKPYELIEIPKGTRIVSLGPEIAPIIRAKVVCQQCTQTKKVCVDCGAQAKWMGAETTSYPPFSYLSDVACCESCMKKRYEAREEGGAEPGLSDNSDFVRVVLGSLGSRSVLFKETSTMIV